MTLQDAAHFDLDRGILCRDSRGLVGHRDVCGVVEYRDAVRVRAGIGGRDRVAEEQPERKRSFRVPFVPLFPLISIACCLVLMLGLPLLTWLRFFSWLLIGLAIYFFYSKSRSTLADPAGE